MECFELPALFPHSSLPSYPFPSLGIAPCQRKGAMSLSHCWVSLKNIFQLLSEEEQRRPAMGDPAVPLLSWKRGPFACCSAPERGSAGVPWKIMSYLKCTSLWEAQTNPASKPRSSFQLYIHLIAYTIICGGTGDSAMTQGLFCPAPLEILPLGSLPGWPLTCRILAKTTLSGFLEGGAGMHARVSAIYCFKIILLNGPLHFTWLVVDLRATSQVKCKWAG